MDVLIATHNRPDFLASTLESILETSGDVGIGRIVVVENGGSVGSQDVCSRFDASALIRFASIPEANKSMALNHGLSLCSDGLIFLTDDDVTVEPGCLAEYEKATVKASGKVFFAGPTRPVFEQDPEPWLKEILPESARGWSSTVEAFESQSLAMGFNWAAFRGDMLEAGGFNPDFGPGSAIGATGQESNMQRRLRGIGAKGVYLAAALVSHRVPAENLDAQWLIKRSFRHGLELGIRCAESNLRNAKRSLLKRRLAILPLRIASALKPNRANVFRYRYARERIRGMREGITLFCRGGLKAPPFL